MVIWYDLIMGDQLVGVFRPADQELLSPYRRMARGAVWRVRDDLSASDVTNT